MTEQYMAQVKTIKFKSRHMGTPLYPVTVLWSKIWPSTLKIRQGDIGHFLNSTGPDRATHALKIRVT